MRLLCLDSATRAASASLPPGWALTAVDCKIWLMCFRSTVLLGFQANSEEQ